MSHVDACTGKTAFVTGATSGIGRATALAFADAGANVVVADISEDGIRDTARAITDLGANALPIRCDVTRADDVEAALAATIDTYGRLDVAFNNAGVEQPAAPLAEIPDDQFDRIMAVDVRGFSCA